MSSGLGFDTDASDDGSVLDALVKLLVADPAQCGRGGLELLVRRSLRVRGWLDAFDARVAVQAARLAAEGASADSATVLGGGGRRSRRDAEAAAARGEVCARMPGVSGALADGTVTAGHVDALVNAARRLDGEAKQRLADHEASLLAAASALTPEQFERECQHLARNLTGDDGLSRHERMRRDRNVRRWVDRHTGMCKTLVSLDPLTDAQAWTAINAAIAATRATNQTGDERSWDQLVADVVVDLLRGGGTATGDPAAGGGERAVPEVSVLIDYHTLLEGDHSASTCETADGQPLPVETIRRLCCEGDIVPIVLGGHGEILDVGHHRRLATRAQRRALRALYRSCAHPQCTVAFDACRIHHVIWWEHHGPTNLANLLPLCETHHHLVHEGGWTLELHPDRRTVWSTPDGTTHYDAITSDRRPHAETVTESDQPRPHPPRRRARRTGTRQRPNVPAHAELQLTLTDLTGRAPP